jgi:CRP-like cAMP-binding protein
MQIDDAATILAGADFFDVCTDEERRMLAFASEWKRYPAGTVILASGDVTAGAQVLISGSISITPDGAGEPNPMVVSQPGAVVSVVSLVVDRPRQVTVTAISIVETLLVPRSSFLKLANQSPQLAARAAARIRKDLTSFVAAVAPMRRKIARD